jgi:pimeloyl-ACP methyl ester carboxylesterase
MTSEESTPFTIDLPLGDLRERLRSTRWPEPLGPGGGIAIDRVRSLVRMWTEDFDWDARQRELNRFAHRRLDGIHFIHERAARRDAPAILLLHGWPGSFVEMLDVIPRLTDSFDVIVPSLPGYGFSDAEPGMSNALMADRFASLMTRLGYDRFFAQGGDWGAGITTYLARRHPSRVAGIHLNYIPGSFQPAIDGPLAPEEQAFLRDRDEWRATSYAYGHVQGTRPLTLAYALNDSPAGLCAWIAEKFDEWGDPESHIADVDLLTNLTIYWLTGTAYSSMRLYLESAKTPLRFEPGERLAAPCAVARFPLEAPFPPRAWVERVYDVRRWSEMPRGGHFAALEQPELLAADLRAFVDGV